MTPLQRENFRRLLTPRHIAFVGGRDAMTAIREARRRGFQNETWAVNPRRKEMEGIPCVQSVIDLPDAPDAVYLAIPTAGAIDTLRTLSSMGSGGAVCFSAGFKETGDRDAEAALIEAAGDMAVVGPNCYGLINYVGNSALWSFEHGGWSPGYGAAIVTQSGMFSSDIAMSQRSLPMAYMVSAGNQAVLGLEDFLEFFGDDAAVRAIGLHIEGLRDIAKFERAALKALERNIPVVALKTGSSRVGAALTVSHTGSLSGSSELYQALFDRTGVISVTNPSQFLETLKFLCTTAPPSGPRVAGFTCSGGGATMLADHGEKIGLVFPEISPDDTAEVAALLPSIATVSNPLDYTTPIWGQPEHTYPVFSRSMQAMNADLAVLVQDYPAEGIDASKAYYRQDADAFARSAAEEGLPAAICATIPENLDEETRRLLIAKGIAPMQGIHETLNAFLDAANWSAVRTRTTKHPPEPVLPGRTGADLYMVSEDMGKDWLKAAGCSVPEGTTVSSEEAASAAKDLGYPVALKMASNRIAHKTEAGAVVLNIRNEDELIAAVARMVKAIGEFDPSVVIDRFLIEAMAPDPPAELIVTFRSDPQFGVVLTIGSGGVLVELLGDTVTLLLPCRADDIARALTSLRVAPLLQEHRGRPRVDIDLLASRIHDLSRAYLDQRDSLAEVEINPLFVYPNDMIAVDVLMHKFVGT